MNHILPKSIVFSGGGMMFLAYAGILSYLQEMRLTKRLRHVVGVSAGAIIGLTYICGYTSEEIRTLVELTDFDRLCNVQVRRMLAGEHHGLSSYNRLFMMLNSLLANKGLSVNITFEELLSRHHYNFITTTTDIMLRIPYVCSAATTPHMKIVDAVLMSAMHPLLYGRMEYNGKWYTDGAITMYYPAIMIRTDSTRLGVWIKPEAMYQSEPNTGGMTIFRHLWEMVMIIQERVTMIEDIDRDTTICLDPVHDSTDFMVSVERKKELMYYGWVKCKEHMESRAISIIQQFIRKYRNERITRLATTTEAEDTF